MQALKGSGGEAEEGDGVKYFSMFSGIGTGEQGIEQAYNHQPGYSATEPRPRPEGDSLHVAVERGEGRTEPCCVGFCEIDKHAEAIYRYHRPEHVNFGDATRIVPGDIPDFDLLVAGFPCQSFSIAGKRLGFDEARGTLFFEIARILSHKRPGHFLLENVRGLLSHDSGKTYQRILGILAELDYFVEGVVLNSKDFGVPQNRERIFLIGHLGSGCAGEVLPFGDGDGGDIEAVRGERSLRGRGKTDAGCLRTRGVNQFDRADLDNLIYPMHVERAPLKFPNRNGKKVDGDYSFTVDTVNTGGVSVNKRIRRLTPVECERLQGLPDFYTAFGRYGDEVREVSDTQRYKGLGNAFTVNVISAIITEMLKKGCLK